MKGEMNERDYVVGKEGCGREGLVEGQKVG